jgi:MFS family permease
MLILHPSTSSTFFGAIVAGDLADWFGRRTTLLAGCAIYMIGVVLQTASAGLAMLVGEWAPEGTAQAIDGRMLIVSLSIAQSVV